MIIEFPQGTIGDIDGYDFKIKKSIRIEITDEEFDCYIGKIVEETQFKKTIKNNKKHDIIE